MSRAGTERRGFTLVELMVVLLIIGLMTAAVVPIYRGSITWVATDRAIRDFAATMKYAQERAVLRGAECRFYMNYESGAYWLAERTETEDGEFAFLPVDEIHGRRTQLPEGFSLDESKARRDRGKEPRGKVHYVRFFPTGACDYATIKLERERRGDIKAQTVTIRTKGHIGQFEVEE